MRFFRNYTSRFPKTSQRLKSIGIFPISNHYYEPLFDINVLRKPLSSERELPGIKINKQQQLYSLEKLNYADEIKRLNWDKMPNHKLDFYLGNGAFESGDAEFLYQFIRYYKPKRIIEIGSGNSTKVMLSAIRANELEYGQKTDLICIEPFENPWLESFPQIQLIRQRIENLNMNWSIELSSGDLLFIDSSHIIRPQGDVLEEFLRIIPSLAKGVFIHVHDVFTPRDYLESWIANEVRFWNEQYLLEALLTHTNRYQVVAALNFLKHHEFESLVKVCPYLTKNREPGSFYIQVID